MSLYYQDDAVTLHHGDSLEVATSLPNGSVDCIVTSPPYYGLRDYGNDGQYGLEESPAAYVETMRALFAELRRVLADDGTLWLNIGDSYSGIRGGKSAPDNKNKHAEADTPSSFTGKGSQRKNLLGIPWRVAFALQDDGWILRNAVVWHKPNAMPESVNDRLSCRYEQFFMFSKSQRYHFDLDPIREELIYPDAADGTRVFGGKNKGNQGGIDATERRRGGKPWTRKLDTSDKTDCGTLTIAQDTAVTDADMLTTMDGMPAPAPQGKYTAADKARPATGRRHTGGHVQGKNPGDMWSINTQPFAGAHFAVMPQELARRAIVSGCKPGGTVLDPFSGSGTTGLVAQNNGRKYVGIDLSEDYLKLSLETRLFNQPLDIGAL
ncbi:DNA-methyltransferase [Paenarthrobacter nicotinovorans]|uniref:DNA-methyltransferase n=1 Tax=Paenarthrobacter nicotinovorans TaxID=29320 RepID=UPI0039A4EA31